MVCHKCGTENPVGNVYCAQCGKKLKRIKAEYIPSDAGAKARLVVLWIFVAFAILMTAVSFGNEKLDMQRKTVEAIGGFGLFCLVGAFFWGFMKWIRVVLPHSFRWANKVGLVLLVIPIFGGLLMAAIYLIVLIVPCAVFGYTFIILWKLAWYGAQNPMDLTANLGMLAGGVACVIVMTYWDICALRYVSPFGIFKRKK